MRRVLISLLASAVAVLAVPGGASAVTLPVPYSLAALISASLTGAPPYSPPGANDWNCTPGPAHPRPVVLVHGLSGNGDNSWQTYAPLLANEGYCVFALTYGVYPGDQGVLAGMGGRAPIDQSSAELARFVDRVRRATGTDRVDLLSWSEGTVVSAGYLQFLDGARAVDKVIALTPLWAGTAIADPLTSQLSALGGLGDMYKSLKPLCAACTDLLAGSDFIARLQASGVYAPGVTYTNIVTRTDMQVQPYTSGIREAPNATNIVLQDVCPVDLSGHLSVSVDPTVAALALRALDPATERAIPCAPSQAPPGV
ncbi:MULTISPECIES: triacylglycerol lipase [unclassified Nocardia]|uniref:esterase/lipase family protein n=1 Tax=unclassified Nocardia TaxID=2637762 RepID=UPI001CE44C2F|nr:MULTISPECIES: alpha/beta fold hydrolase [unclassified Nocardia]